MQFLKTLLMSRVGYGAALAVTLLALAPLDVAGQYFGRNKVQYDDFEFSVIGTEHFDIHYYPVEGEAVEDAARMSERWYERFARSFQHEFEDRKPIIFYADHPDFQQTNTLGGFIGEGTGGVTESLKNRVIMPLTGSYWDTDHVLGHELVHAFQYNIAQSRRGGGLQGLSALPLWLIEGMAEYLSVGRDDPLTAMWIRDAIRRDDLPTIHQLTTSTKFFPYRFGQALWAYIGGTYGDDAVIEIYRRSLRVGFEGAIQQVLGMPTDTLSLQWKEKVAEELLPFMVDREAPTDQGTLLLAPSTGSGKQNVSPSVSPDGRFVAFLSEKDIFSVDLYMADAETGEIIRKLSSANSDPHSDALRYIDSSGTWSPDGEYFAFVVTAGGATEMVIIESNDGTEFQRVAMSEIGAVTQPAWSPDGRYIAFSGSVGGISDLYTYDLESGSVIRLTNDKYGDFQPAWSPDGRTIAFASDRGPETDFERLTTSEFQLSLLDVPTGRVTWLPVFGNVKHMNPQYAPDGESLYFISDQDGVSDIYELDFEAGDVRRITRLATGVSGITYMSPAMTVAANTGRIIYSVFDEREFHIYAADPQAGVPANIVADAHEQPGRKLTPANPARFSRVSTYLSDPMTGLMSSGTYTVEDAEEYESGLALDFVGQPTLGVGADNFGSYVSGGVFAYFSDMLGDRMLGVSISAQGTFKDIGGQLFYQNLDKRWNWGGGLARIVYPFGSYGYGQEENGDLFLGRTTYRIFLSAASAQVAYPFSQTQRIEAATGVTRYSYDIEIDKFAADPFGRIGGQYSRESLPAPGALNLMQSSLALVGDNAFFGFVSPIQGGRHRFEVEQTYGQVDYTTITADWRRYFAPHRNLTVGVRGLHYGRYGLSAEENQEDEFGLLLRPLFLGYETFIRGYAYESFDAGECNVSFQDVFLGGNGCPAFDRLFGNQLAVANFEFRIPFIGVEQYGIVNFPFLPTELVLFADAGLAWDGENSPSLEWSRSGTDRVPLISTGVSARINILGFMILETYYAYPWQRPAKGWHWGFNLAPGW